MRKNIAVFLSLAVCFSKINAQDKSPQKVPLDGIVERHLVEQRIPLAYPNVQEGNLLWEKRIWQIIDTREKINQPFRYPLQPFFEILVKAIKEGEIVAYSSENDQFNIPLDKKKLKELLFRADTFEIVDPNTWEIRHQIVERGINYEEIIRFQLKEVWYFDTATSSMKSRILGIAPIRATYREDGVIKHETPLFWIYYPHCRSILAKHLVFNPWNDHSVLSWEDLFEMRFFSSYIYKESNVKNERIRDYASGRDILVESNRIKRELFNFEHDLWSY